MNIEAWIAIAGLVVSILVVALGGAFQMGKHAQRITALEEKTRDLPAIAVLNATLLALKEKLGDMEAAMLKRIEDMEHDFRGILTGKIIPARRQRDGD